MQFQIFGTSLVKAISKYVSKVSISDSNTQIYPIIVDMITRVVEQTNEFIGL